MAQKGMVNMISPSEDAASEVVVLKPERTALVVHVLQHAGPDNQMFAGFD